MSKALYLNNQGKYQKDYDSLYKKLVPSNGHASTPQGELLAAVSKMYYRYYNDGDLYSTFMAEYLDNTDGDPTFELTPRHQRFWRDTAAEIELIESLRDFDDECISDEEYKKWHKKEDKIHKEAYDKFMDRVICRIKREIDDELQSAPDVLSKPKHSKREQTPSPKCSKSEMPKPTSKKEKPKKECAPPSLTCYTVHIKNDDIILLCSSRDVLIKKIIDIADDVGAEARVVVKGKKELRHAMLTSASAFKLESDLVIFHNGDDSKGGITFHNGVKDHTDLDIMELYRDILLVWESE